MITLLEAQRLKDAGLKLNMTRCNLIISDHGGSCVFGTYNPTPLILPEHDYYAPNSDELMAAIQEHPKDDVWIEDSCSKCRCAIDRPEHIIQTALHLWGVGHPNEPFILRCALVDLYCKLAAS